MKRTTVRSYLGCVATSRLDTWRGRGQSDRRSDAPNGPCSLCIGSSRAASIPEDNAAERWRRFLAAAIVSDDLLLAAMESEGIIPLLQAPAAARGNGQASGSSDLENGAIRVPKPQEQPEFRRRFADTDEDILQFRSSLFCLGLDQSTAVRKLVSWSVFILMAIAVPTMNALAVDCRHCDENHRHPFQGIVELSEAALATVSFLCISHILSVYGLRKLLLFDYIARDSTAVQLAYKRELNIAFRVVAMILLPTFLASLAHKLWWFLYVSVRVPLLSESLLVNALMCMAVMAAWLYKTTIFLFVCVLFRLLCSLQILRLESYNKLVEETSDVSAILSEHMRIRDQLNIISHRFRIFLVSSLVTITFSQFISLLLLTTSSGSVNFFRAGDLAVCSAVQLAGFVVCLHGAARITHRAQRIVSVVSKWHAVATCGVYDAAVDVEQGSPLSLPVDTKSSVDNPRECWKDRTECFHKRQALVTYLQHCSAGISLYGFVLDRGFLYAIFGIELSLVLFILGNTVGIH